MRLLKWLCLGAAVWMGYWAIAAWGLNHSLQGWFAEQERQGWQVEFGEITTSGFPTHHRTTVFQPLLADPGTGAAWSADWVKLESPALWPGIQTLHFPATAQRYSFFDQTSRLVAQDMRADLQLAPGLALTLEHLALNSAAWQVSEGADVIWQAEDLVLQMSQLPQPQDYVITASASGFTPGGLFRRMHRPADTLPAEFSVLELQGTVTFDTPWDRRALELRRPQPRHIALDLAEARWGEMWLRAAGALQVDEQGRLDGELTLRIENWRQILDLAERSSLLPPSGRAAMERVLALFARDSGQGDKLDTSLSISKGQVWLGPLPLGTAPRLVLH